jgi:hypothetical protein
MLAPDQYAKHMPNADWRYKPLLINVLLAAAKISDFAQCPKNGISPLGFGTSRWFEMAYVRNKNNGPSAARLMIPTATHQAGAGGGMAPTGCSAWRADRLFCQRCRN